MSKGKVETYNTDRGYGVIVDSETGQKLTVYSNYTDLKTGETLTEGLEVEYDIESNRHRNFAINVKVLLGQ